MSTQAVTLVKAHTFGSASTKAILFVLADYADSEWSSFASQKRIAAEAEVGERTVRRTLADLESQGIIHRERRHRKDGTRTSDRLMLVPDAIQALPASMTASDDEGLPATVTATTGQPRQSLPATVTEPTGQALAAHEPSVEPSEEPSVEPFAASRKRDPIWDVFVAIFGQPETKSERGKWNTAAKELRDIDADPDEIVRRAQNWPVLYPGATLTPMALVVHWTALGRPALRASKGQVRDFEREREHQARLAAAREMDERKALEA